MLHTKPLALLNHYVDRRYAQLYITLEVQDSPNRIRRYKALRNCLPSIPMIACTALYSKKGGYYAYEAPGWHCSRF